MRSILIVEDDLNIMILLQKIFEREINLRFTYATTYESGVLQATQESFDLYIIDVNLEGFSGFDILKILQKEKNIDNRIIVISSDNSTKLAIQAYELGASNFINKPLDFDLLRAILKKNIRSLETKESGELNLRHIILSPQNHSCFFKEGDNKREINLTPIEFSILYHLARSANIVVSKEDLCFDGKDRNDPMSLKALEMHISCIRKKIGSSFIKTKRGVGYFLVG